MMEKRRSRRWPWWPLAIALLLTFLAHDLLMAAPPAEPGHAVHAGESNAAHVATTDSGHVPLHPSTCGVSQQAAPLTPPSSEAAATAALGGAASLLTFQFVPPLLPDTCEPVHPPSVRRALLQVYRI